MVAPEEGWVLRVVNSSWRTVAAVLATLGIVVVAWTVYSRYWPHNTGRLVVSYQPIGDTYVLYEDHEDRLGGATVDAPYDTGVREDRRRWRGVVGEINGLNDEDYWSVSFPDRRRTLRVRSLYYGDSHTMSSLLRTPVPIWIWRNQPEHDTVRVDVHEIAPSRHITHEDVTGTKVRFAGRDVRQVIVAMRGEDREKGTYLIWVK